MLNSGNVLVTGASGFVGGHRVMVISGVWKQVEEVAYPVG